MPEESFRLIQGSAPHLFPVEFLPPPLLQEGLLHRICAVLGLGKALCLAVCPRLPLTPQCGAACSLLCSRPWRTPPRSCLQGACSQVLLPNEALSSLKEFTVSFTFVFLPTSLSIPISTGMCVSYCFNIGARRGEGEREGSGEGGREERQGGSGCGVRQRRRTLFC